MEANLWITYVAVCATIAMTPGPIIIFSMKSVQEFGLKVAWVIIPAIVIGDACAMAVALSGVSAILLVFPSLHLFVKLIGAGVLIWVGISGLRPMSTHLTDSTICNAKSRLFFVAFFLAALHPGAFLFYSAFFTQFIDFNYSVMRQIMILSAVFLFVAAISLSIWMVVADRLSRSFTNSRVTARLNTFGSAVIILIGTASMLTSLGELN